ncbi:hypothetical protein GCM10023093_03500 [Nemorincola caseinilytica]|uniref:Uncharacterized protein n=2 Tax=Nemorincola caseinilytica TaxID=2054315 RepID=A0ABP8N3C3_9BACT
MAATVVDRVVQLSWQCQYDGVKTIIVRRSSDSLRNYTDIGNVRNTTKGIQTFTDERPLHGRAYYKLTIVFVSGLKWGSNHCGITTDDVAMPTLAPVAAAPGASWGSDRPQVYISSPMPDMDDASFIIPIHIRPNPTTGHIDMRLPDDHGAHVYSVAFFNAKKQMVFDIPAIKARVSILDKRNFQRKGQYRFILRRDGVIFETGYVIVDL